MNTFPKLTAGEQQVNLTDDITDQQYQPDLYGVNLARDWARISKVAEELGEAIAEFIALTGQNPRKPKNGSPDKFQDEICDVIITGILCLQHFTKNVTETEQTLADRWRYRETKLQLATIPGHTQERSQATETAGKETL